MKVMHVLNSRVYSGAEKVVCQIIRSFQNEDGMEMVYCSPESEILRELVGGQGIRYVPLPSLNPSDLGRVLAQEKPDLIHAHDMRAGFVSALCCGKTPLVSHIHNNAFDSRGLSFKSVAYLLAAGKAKQILWVSDNAFTGYRFHKLFRRKSSVLKNIIDTDEIFCKREQDAAGYDFDIIFVGRLSYPKDPQRLLRVCALVKAQKQDVKLGIVGAGELEEELKALCTELGLQENVQFLGFQSNPMKMISDSKAMVLTSRWEGIPMCALEAMALGTPIVSTPVGDMKDLIENGVNGYLCAEDAALADSLLAILTDPAHRAALSEKTLEKFARINDPVTYRQTLAAIYQRGTL